MSAARPFHLLGERQLEEVGACIQQALPDLSSHWWRDRALQLIGVTRWREELRDGPVRFLVRGEAGRWLGVLGTESAWLKLGEGWLGCHVPSSGPLVATLQREFCRALYAAVAGADGSAAVLEHVSWSDIPDEALRTGGGALVIEFDVEGVPLAVLAPIALWPKSAEWNAPARGQKLQQVAASLQESKVDLDVRLPVSRIPMTEMGTLAIGDFLDLQQDLSGRVRLSSERADIELTGVLGRQDEHKAIRIESKGGKQ